jgi:hypothetical protein
MWWGICIPYALLFGESRRASLYSLEGNIEALREGWEAVARGLQ